MGRLHRGRGTRNRMTGRERLLGFLGDHAERTYSLLDFAKETGFVPEDMTLSTMKSEIPHDGHGTGFACPVAAYLLNVMTLTTPTAPKRDFAALMRRYPVMANVCNRDFDWMETMLRALMRRARNIGLVAARDADWNAANEFDPDDGNGSGGDRARLDISGFMLRGMFTQSIMDPIRWNTVRSSERWGGRWNAMNSRQRSSLGVSTFPRFASAPGMDALAFASTHLPDRPEWERAWARRDDDPKGVGIALAEAWRDFYDMGGGYFAIGSFPTVSTFRGWMRIMDGSATADVPMATGSVRAMGLLMAAVAPRRRESLCSRVLSAMECGRADYGFVVGRAQSMDGIGVFDLDSPGSLRELADFVMTAPEPSSALGALRMFDVLATLEGGDPADSGRRISSMNRFHMAHIRDRFPADGVSDAAGMLDRGLPVDMAAEIPSLHRLTTMSEKAPVF